jgi:hypothetical protein
MKKFAPIGIGLLTTLLFSCQQEDPQPQQLKGKLHIDIGVSIEVNEVSNYLKSAHQTEDFKVIIYDAAGTAVMSYESVLAMPDTIELEIGDYYVEAHSDNNLPAAFENPYYYGNSGSFTVSGETVQTVQVTCELANTIVSVVYSENVISNFSEALTTVSSSAGSLVYARDETRLGYFQTLPLTILVELVYQHPDGSENTKTLSGEIPEPLANRHYEVHVDANPEGGSATFQILLDETPVLVEVVEIDDGSSVPAGGVGYGAILITEVMYDPSGLSDTEGEWFEVYNNSGQSINLQNLVLERDDINRHVITESIELLPAHYYVFQRTDQATEASNSYTYGSDITLSNTGATLAIYNEGTESDPGALIFSLNYGDTGFPGGTGASICLSPLSFNAAAAISGSSWCTSTSVYYTGDAGTPGAPNDSCQ